MPDFANIEHLEADLWDAADNLRANSKLTAGEYCMPVLGVIFLRHATNRYNAALRVLELPEQTGTRRIRHVLAGEQRGDRIGCRHSTSGQVLALPPSLPPPDRPVKTTEKPL